MKATITVTQTSKTLRAVEIRFSNGDFTYYERLTRNQAEQIVDEIYRDSKYSEVEIVRQ